MSLVDGVGGLSCLAYVLVRVRSPGTIEACRTVTMFDTFGPHEGAFDDPITGTLYEGHAPQVAMKMRDTSEYEATLDTAQFTLWREPVEESRWPVGKGTPPFGSLRATRRASAYDEKEK